MQACLAACTLVRRACEAAFKEKKRAMVAPDVIEHIGSVFEALCPAEPDAIHTELTIGSRAAPAQ